MPPPHRRRFETPNQARFITFSCYQQLALFQNDQIKNLFASQLRETHRQTNFHMIAWVIMPEHIHLLLIPDLPVHPVSSILEDLKRPFAKRVLNRWEELNAPVLDRLTDSRGKRHFWQRGGGYDRNLAGEKQIRAKADYIHANPVRRGLVESPHDWVWSSARYYAGLEDAVV